MIKQINYLANLSQGQWVNFEDATTRKMIRCKLIQAFKRAEKMEHIEVEVDYQDQEYPVRFRMIDHEVKVTAVDLARERKQRGLVAAPECFPMVGAA
jgi:uncharacterized protein YnzC (UPF0291/DUF896 family)